MVPHSILWLTFITACGNRTKSWCICFTYMDTGFNSATTHSKSAGGGSKREEIGKHTIFIISKWIFSVALKKNILYFECHLIIVYTHSHAASIYVVRHWWSHPKWSSICKWVSKILVIESHQQRLQGKTVDLLEIISVHDKNTMCSHVYVVEWTCHS